MVLCHESQHSDHYHGGDLYFRLNSKKNLLMYGSSKITTRFAEPVSKKCHTNKNVNKNTLGILRLSEVLELERKWGTGRKSAPWGCGSEDDRGKLAVRGGRRCELAACLRLPGCKSTESCQLAIRSFHDRNLKFGTIDSYRPHTAPGVGGKRM